MSCKILSEILNFKSNKHSFTIEERVELLKGFKADLIDAANSAPDFEENSVRIKI